MKGIADTGFLVAFSNANDKHHAWASQIAADVTEPLLSCEAVMAETAFHLKSTAVALAMLNEGLVSQASRGRPEPFELAGGPLRSCLQRRARIVPRGITPARVSRCEPI